MLTMSIMDRFAQRYIPVTESGCWLWTACLDHDGYGVFYADARNVRAHRFSYQVFRGCIDRGLTIDHLCRVRCCVNPDHLEVVTKRINTLRGIGPVAINARRMTCINNHPFSPDNTYTHLNKYGYPSRSCRACNREYVARYQKGMML